MSLEQKIRKMLEEQAATRQEELLDESAAGQDFPGMPKPNTSATAGAKGKGTNVSKEATPGQSGSTSEGGASDSEASKNSEIQAGQGGAKSSGTPQKTTQSTPGQTESVSAQVASLLEVEGLSEEFKVGAVAIFEAAVADRVLQLKEELEAQNQELFEAEKLALVENIDGFLNEAVQTWIAENEVAISSNFRSQLTESFMDGLVQLMAEHNIDLPEDGEDALEVALDQVEKLEEEKSEVEAQVASLQEQINKMQGSQIRESFRGMMTQTEFDRFVTLTESIEFTTEAQFKKQMSTVLENFGSTSKTAAVKVITEDTPAPVQTGTAGVNKYADYIGRK